MLNQKFPTVLHIHFWADIRNTSGSVEKVITTLASHGIRYQHRIACCPSERVTPSIFEFHGIQVHTFYEQRLKNRLLNKMLRMGAFTYSDLVQIIRQLRPELLHFHNRQELVDAVIDRLDYRPGVVVHYHRHFAQPIIPKEADLLIAVSQRTRDYLLSKTATTLEIRVLANPLSVELLDAATRSKPNMTTNAPPIILFGGGASRLKGGTELIQAFKRLAPGSARLILAGSGVEQLPGLPHPDIVVVGRIPAAEFMLLMEQSDIVAMPSADESFGLIAQEAMAMWRLLVVSNTGGLTEFTSSDSAVLVQPGDVCSIENGLRQALSLLHPNSVEQRILMLERAYERLRSYDPRHIISELECIYDAVLAGRPQKITQLCH